MKAMDKAFCVTLRTSTTTTYMVLKATHSRKGIEAS